MWFFCALLTCFRTTTYDNYEIYYRVFVPNDTTAITFRSSITNWNDCQAQITSAITWANSQEFPGYPCLFGNNFCRALGWMTIYGTDETLYTLSTTTFSPMYGLRPGGWVYLSMIKSPLVGDCSVKISVSTNSTCPSQTAPNVAVGTGVSSCINYTLVTTSGSSFVRGLSNTTQHTYSMNIPTGTCRVWLTLLSDVGGWSVGSGYGISTNNPVILSGGNNGTHFTYTSTIKYPPYGPYYLSVFTQYEIATYNLTIGWVTCNNSIGAGDWPSGPKPDCDGPLEDFTIGSNLPTTLSKIIAASGDGYYGATYARLVRVPYWSGYLNVTCSSNTSTPSVLEMAPETLMVDCNNVYTFSSTSCYSPYFSDYILLPSQKVFVEGNWVFGFCTRSTTPVNI